MTTARDDLALGLGTGITRRDFIGGVLIGTGAALLGQACPAAAWWSRGDEWTGYGGVGDYRFSNGNTAQVVKAAHRVRDGGYTDALQKVEDTAETYDLIIVGAGFTGMAALYEFNQRRPRGTCLMLDNHPIFGGHAKQNEFDVDGYRVAGPQASINFFIPSVGPNRPSAARRYWEALGLPDQFAFAPRAGGNPEIAFCKGTSPPMYWDEQSATIGYFFKDTATSPTGEWLTDIWNDDLQRTRWSDQFKQELVAFRGSHMRDTSKADAPAWLDRMTYADYVTRVLGFRPEVLRYIDPILAVPSGATSDAISAYGASLWGMPGVGRYAGRSPLTGNNYLSFPGGNATLFRHFLKAVLPEAIAGPRTFEAIATNAVNFSKLDRPGAAIRMRLQATAVRVAHDGEPSRSAGVSVIYEQSGRLFRVRAKAVVMAIGSWMAKRVVADLPTEYRTAFGHFFHGPILMINVALRNWRFLDKLGISAARWFDGFGFYASVRHPMVVGHRQPPFHPDQPIVMTFYVPFPRPGLPIAAQGPAGRAELFGTSYADYERRLRAQMQTLFAAGGFEVKRDIAGIVLNRWGHAFVSPQPGFFFGQDGQRPPRDIVRQRFGRIAFAHSEYHGPQSWEGAASEGHRALEQVSDLVG